MLETIIALSFPIVAVVAAALISKRVMNRTQNVHQSLHFNFATLGVMLVLFVIFGFSVSADATTTTTAVVDTTINKGLGLLAACICTSITGIGAGIALASAIPAAIAAISENPKTFSKAIIFVALGEAIALYGVVISFMILMKISNI